MTRVTIYSKPDCHLCDVVKEMIERVRAQRPFHLEVKNILDDPEAEQAYKHDIPVIMINGKELARHKLSEQRLLGALDRVANA